MLLWPVMFCSPSVNLLLRLHSLNLSWRSFIGDYFRMESLELDT
ncbi:hypothetical protein MPTK1_6g09290 [Marchantia polymorpha subsp. ruderalis]|uniref:Uncharacterized protein n=1 Tax=Marchantia polymorpha subsp. ruderalis TaxID=1480154 RepID=A0AAF6BQ66_MARPO|nr:hypothetical protein Mp_6g09290 [Marchantia polymorpha subsp. ruderalis]